eukprot:370186_1
MDREEWLVAAEVLDDLDECALHLVGILQVHQVCDILLEAHGCDGPRRGGGQRIRTEEAPVLPSLLGGNESNNAKYCAQDAYDDQDRRDDPEGKQLPGRAAEDPVKVDAYRLRRGASRVGG